MRWLLCLFLLVGGCAGPATIARDDPMFAPTKLRIHPVFSKISDWTGDGKADGIDVLVEFQDAFGDTCKGRGTLNFELFGFADESPDSRGRRICDPWLVEIASADQQRQRWSRTGRGYSFRLAVDRISAADRYVLAGTFSQAGGQRLFDRLVIGGEK